MLQLKTPSSQAPGGSPSQNPTAPAPFCAFARLDLLAIVAVLGLVAFLNTAAVTNSRAGSRAAGCLANLRLLTLAWAQYATDDGLFPPTPDDGTTVPGRSIIPGEAGAGAAQEFNSDILADRSRSLLVPYLSEDVRVFRCPADLRRGRYQGSDFAKRGVVVDAARSYSINQTVGTDPYPPSNGQLASNGPWLDNSHSHFRGETWRTYARFEDIVSPTPQNLIIFLGEDAFSINDAVWAFGMQRAEWIDWPSTRHEMGGALSFADGHTELHHWVDARTAVVNANVSRRLAPNSPDYQLFHDHISAPIRP